MNTIKLTMAQALVRFLDNQYLEADGTEYKFVEGIFGIFGHGNVVGLGEAIVEGRHGLIFRQGHSEQGMAHAAIGFAKQNDRRRIYAVTSSIGPGAMNLVTAAATATVNRIPLLLLPGDTFACRQPDPVLQQVESPHDLTISANDAFKPVSAYWDRIGRPEQLMSAAINAMRVLTDPAATGAVTLALPQDVQAESYDYPCSFLRKRVHHLERRSLSTAALARLADLVAACKRPLLILGGGVRYSDAGARFDAFAREFGVPFGETQAGKGTIAWDHPLNLGGIGVTGSAAANVIARDCDLLLAVGTRLGDFTTASKYAFRHPDLRVATINVNAFDAHKMDAEPFIADARTALEQLTPPLRDRGWSAGYHGEVTTAIEAWNEEVDRLYRSEDPRGLSQTRVLGELNERLLPPDAVVVSASGSLPGDMQRVWRARSNGSYHMEYGFSCMGYEINATVGAKLAAPGRPAIAMVGDGGFVMLHSELVTAIQEALPIIVLVFDNNGFQVIDNLQTGQGIESYGNEWRRRDPTTGDLNGEYLAIDYAAIARGYGATSYSVRTLTELADAVTAGLQAATPVVIDVKVTPKSMTRGYESWWRVGVPEISTRAAVRAARKALEAHLPDVRRF